MQYLEAKGWISKEERIFLKSLAEEYRRENALFINIGVEFGASLVCLRAGNATAGIVGIDLDTSKFVGQGKYHLIQSDSAAWVSSVPDQVKQRGIDILFIDGDHGEAGVTADASLSKYLVDGGCIVFHDCFNPEVPGEIHPLVPGVNVAVDAWFRGQKPGSFIEQPSVASIRWFRRVDSATRISNSNTDIQSAGNRNENSTAPVRKSKV